MAFPIVSVVVPVYKVEAFLQECIDSILTQTYTDFELILVNDGSPDASGRICDENAKKDVRIRVLHQENLGVTRARANGVSMARGEFITFVDSDDTLLPDALKLLMEPVNTDVDIVLARYEGGRVLPAGEISLAEYREMCAVMRGIDVGPFAKLFRRCLFNDAIFNLPRELSVGEDAVMNIRLAYRAAGKVYSTGKIVYRYRENESSVMHTSKPSPEMDVLLQKYRLASIPPDDVDLYLPQGLADSLIHHWINATIHTVRIPSGAFKHYYYLRSIKKYAHLKLGVYPGILFYCNHAMVRAFVIGVRYLVKHFLFK